MSVAVRPVPPLRRRGLGGANFSDRVFRWGTLLFALAVVLIVLALAAVVLRSSLPALAAFGARFLVTRVWNPVQDEFGALPFIYGTVVTSIVALLLAAGFVMALEVRSVLAGPDSAPGAEPSKPKHEWSDVEGHGIDAAGWWLGTTVDQALELLEAEGAGRAAALAPDRAGRVARAVRQGPSRRHRALFHGDAGRAGEAPPHR